MSGTKSGKGGLEMVSLVHSSGANAEIYLWGATLTSYKTPDGKERIFCSPAAIFDGKKAIRGGVPVVFPQFGQPSKDLPQHGFARTSQWTVLSIMDTVEASYAIFELQDSSETRAVWDFSFQLQYTVFLTASSLTMSLKVHNIGQNLFRFHALLHTYLVIPDISDVRVSGLAGRKYVDKAAGGDTKVEQSDEIAVPSFVDRIYIASGLGRACDVVVRTSKGTPVAMTINEGRIRGELQPCDVVVWNPYESNSPADLPPPAFKEFVCVEPGLVNEFQSLDPNELAELSQRIIPLSFERGGSVCICS